jgi:hypothetical protein
MALDFSLGISWQFGALAVLSMLLFPFFRGRYAFLAGALAYSLVDIVPAILAGASPQQLALALFDPKSSLPVGLWTITGAVTWGIVGYIFTLQKPDGSPLTFAKLGIAGTMVFDAITGPIASTFIWGMPFADALAGQIPFTAKHLFGIAAVSIVLAPLLFPSVRKALSGRKLFALKPAHALA